MSRFPLNDATPSNMRQSTLPVPYKLSISQTNSLNVGHPSPSRYPHFSAAPTATNTSFCLMPLTVRPLLTAHQCWISLIHPSAPNSRPAIPPTTSLFSATTPESVFNFTTSNFGFASTSPLHGLSQMRTRSNYHDVHFNLTFSISSPVLLNGGTGSFEVTGGTGLRMVHAHRQVNWHTNSERYNRNH